jgi:hypothetical protein
MTKKAVKKKQETPRPTSPLSAETLESWHKSLAQASGMLSLTLSRRRRSPTLIAQMLKLIEPVVEEMRAHENNNG